MSQSIRIALVGCGGRLQTVAKCLNQATSSVSYTGILDPAESSRTYAREHFCPNGRIYTSMDDVVHDPEVDWVMIGSPNHLHAQQAIAAMKAGKHIFCEKPLATTMGDLAAMREAWEESGVTFVLGLTLRHAPLYRLIRQFIDEGRIGHLISMEFNETLDFDHGGHVHSHPWRRKTAFGGSHLLEKCCHDLDLALWMVGSLPRKVASFGGRNFFIPEHVGFTEELGVSPEGKQAFVSWPCIGERVNPFSGDSDVVDNQVGIIEFENSVRATFHTNCAAALPERRMLLLGTQGSIRADLRAATLDICRMGYNEKVETVKVGNGGEHGGGDKILGQELAATMLQGEPPRATLTHGLNSALLSFAMNDAMHCSTVVDCASYWKRVRPSATCEDRKPVRVSTD